MTKRTSLLLVMVLWLPSVAWSQLYFPRLLSPGEMSTTGFALVNLNDSSAGVTFTFYTESGIPLGSAQMVIPPGGQLAKLGSELFPGAFSNVWTQVISNVPLQGFWLSGDFSTNEDGGAAAVASRDQLFPLVAGQTEINIANPNPAASTVTIRLLDADGADMAAAVTRSISVNGVFQAQISSLFPTVNLSLARHIRVTSVAPVVGTSVIRGFLSNESVVLNGVDFGSRLTELNFPHVVSGGTGDTNYTTVLGVTNLSGGSQAITFTFHPEPGGAAISVSRNVVVGGSVRDTAQSLFGFAGGFQNGWVQVSGSAPLTGFVAYAETISGGVAVVPVQAVPTSVMVFPHVAGQPTWYTGVGLLNTGTTPAQVEIYTMTSAGELAGGAANVPTAKVTVDAGHKTAAVLSQFVPATLAQNGGFVFVRSTNGVPLYGMELFGSVTGRIIANVAASGIPAGINYQPPPPTPPPGPPVILSQPANTNTSTGQTATFSVTGTGTVPFSYRWMKNGADIPDANGRSYTTPPASANDNGAVYTVVVSNGLGNVTSTTATLAVATSASAVFLTTQPVASMSINVGGIPEFSVSATGITPNYQWRKNGVPIPGATSATYVAPAATVNDDKSVYSVMVCNIGGCRTSSNASLTVVGASVSPVKQFSAGNLHSLAVREDGTVWGWGTSSNGRLGINRPQTYPTQGIAVAAVDPGDIPSKNAVSVRTAFSHSLLLRSDGTVWGAGTNTYGELGTANGVEYYAFAMTLSEPGIPFIDAKYINAASGNSYAITKDGSAWAWGNNLYSQIGDGTATNRNVPTRVTDAQGNPFKNVIAAAGGGIHTLWLKDDGTVWAVGTNTNGSLGDGTTTTRAVPVRVELSAGVALTNVIAVSASGNQSAALRADGTVYRWGGGVNRPAQIQASVGVPLTGVTAIELASTNIVCLLADGTVVTIGATGSAPVLLRNADNTPFSGVRAISAQQLHMLAQKSDGTVWAWGDNNGKRLGDGTTTSRVNPVRVQGLAP